MIEVHLFFWPIVFEHLGPGDLLCVVSICYTWWQFVFYGWRKSTAQSFLECEELDLGDTGTMYEKFPLKFFTWLSEINLARTSISSKHFLKLVAASRQLGVLNIEGCALISERAISV